MDNITSSLKKEKENKFKEFESKWASDPKILKLSKVGWLNTRGKFLIQQNQLEDGINDLKEALEIDPKCISAHTSLAAAFSVKKDFDKAIELLTNAEKIINEKGFTTSATGEFNEMEALDVYFFFGLVYEEAGNKERALEYFQEFLKINQTIKNSSAWHDLQIYDKHFSPQPGSAEKNHEYMVKVVNEGIEKLKSENEKLPRNI